MGSTVTRRMREPRTCLRGDSSAASIVMRVLSNILFALAGLVGVVAIVAYRFMTNLACGYAPRSSGCRGWPWELGSDDRLWLVQFPSGTVVALIAAAIFLRRKGGGTDDPQ